MKSHGHLRERSPGHWAIILDSRDAANGKRKQIWHKFKGNRTQAKSELARLVTERDAGTLLEPNKTTLAQFLGRWLEHIKPQISPRSHERYSELATKNIVPLLGGVILAKLKPMQISEAYGKALASGRRDGTGGLAPRTVHHMHRILKQALGQAVKWQLLTRNPADACNPPKVERTSMVAFDMAQTAELLHALRGRRIFTPTILAVLCGLRRGEICALRWRNVDLAKGQLAVVESAEQTKAGVRFKEPKSGRAHTVSLSATVVDELQAHRLRQAEELLRVGVRLSDDTLLVCQADGMLLQPRSLTHEWIRLLGKTSLPRARFHDLRHAHATHMLANGVHPKVASERLGHSKVGITLDLYSHVMPGMQDDAAARVDDALRTAINRRSDPK
jgi:integrase